MSVDNALLDVQDVIAAKIETTTGTPIALAGADGSFEVTNPTLEEDVPEIERPGQGSASPNASVPGPRSGRFKFRVPVTGSGTTGVPPWASTFLAACGWVNTNGVFSPVTGSTSQPTLTIGKYEDGVFRSIAGAKGDFTIEGTSGGIVYIDFDFLGTLQPESDVAMIAPTYPTVIPPRFAGSTFTIGAYSPLISKFTIKAGNQLYLRPDSNNITGYHACAIADRKPMLTIDPEATLVATKDWQNLQFTSAQEALAIIIGSADNNIVAFDAPKAQVVKKARGSRNKIRTNELDFRLCRNSAAGDDELIITFTAPA